MIVKGIKCPSCDDVVWSRGQYDFRYCSCRRSWVDGGREYLRIGGIAAKEPQKHIIDISLDDRDARVWRSGGRYLTHREMSDDHLKNCIVHLHNRIEESENEEEMGLKLVENRAELRRIIEEMKEELAHRGVFNIAGEVH